MEIKVLKELFTVCKVENAAEIDLQKEFCFVGKTDTELSLVCMTKDVPKTAVMREDGWRAMRIQGTLDFSLVGILAKIAALLAERQISIFAVSTYDTDYILLKEGCLAEAVEVLHAAGYQMITA